MCIANAAKAFMIDILGSQTRITSTSGSPCNFAFNVAFIMTYTFMTFALYPLNRMLKRPL